MQPSPIRKFEWPLAFDINVVLLWHDTGNSISCRPRSILRIAFAHSASRATLRASGVQRGLLCLSVAEQDVYLLGNISNGPKQRAGK